MRAISPLLAVLAAFVAAGCTITETRTVTDTVTETNTIVVPEEEQGVTETTPIPVVPPATQPRAAQRQVLVYLLRGERLGPARRVVRTPAVALETMRELLEAPSSHDEVYGLGSSIPAGTHVRGVSIRSGTATVDLTRRFAAGGGSLSMLTRVAQVVYTLTQFEGVERVAFRIDGTRVDAIGGEGIVVWPAVSRADFEGQAPAILVEHPAPGDAVRSPLVVRGTANVFEAVLFVELRDGASLVARRRVQASSGTGTRGTFATSVPFVRASVAEPVLVAYSLSPKDGSRINEVRIPLVRAPGL